MDSAPTFAVLEGQEAKPKIAFAIAVFMVSVVVLSVAVFMPQSLRLDESQSLWQSAHSPSMILYIVAQDVHVPLYHFLLHYWQIILGNGVAAARALSLVFFLLALPSLYSLAKKLGSFVALFAVFLLTVSPFMNWYGNEIRMYSLLVLVSIWNQHYFLEIMRSRPEERRPWGMYFLTVVCGMFTHYFFLFSLAAQALFFTVHRRSFPYGSFKRFVLVAIAAAGVFAPWLVYVVSLGTASNSQPLIPVPSIINVFNTFSQFLFGFQTDAVNSILLSLWPVAFVAIFLSLQRSKKISLEVMYFVYALFVPIFIAFVVSIIYKPLYLSRYLIGTLPAFYILLSWLFSVYSPRISSLARNTLIVAMAFTFYVQTVNANTPVKENYREAAEYIESRATPEDIIVVSAPFTIYPLEYYYRGPTALATLPVWNQRVSGGIPAFSQAALPAQVNSLSENHRVLWLLLSYDQGYEEKIRLYFDTHFKRLETQNFSPDLTLYAYQLRYNSPTLGSTLAKLASEQGKQ